jgi:phage FluMu protein Com
MKNHTVYCPSCDKDVHVTLTPAPLHGGTSNIPDAPELVCLTFGSSCSSGRCPVSGLPSLVMGVRLARSGIDPDEPWSTIRVRCETCERVTEMEVLDDLHAFCPECQTTNRWMKLDVGEEAVFVALP